MRAMVCIVSLLALLVAASAEAAGSGGIGDDAKRAMEKEIGEILDILKVSVQSSAPATFKEGLYCPYAFVNRPSFGRVPADESDRFQKARERFLRKKVVCRKYISKDRCVSAEFDKETLNLIYLYVEGDDNAAGGEIGRLRKGIPKLFDKYKARVAKDGFTTGKLVVREIKGNYKCDMGVSYKGLECRGKGMDAMLAPYGVLIFLIHDRLGTPDLNASMNEDAAYQAGVKYILDGSSALGRRRKDLKFKKVSGKKCVVDVLSYGKTPPEAAQHLAVQFKSLIYWKGKLYAQADFVVDEITGGVYDVELTSMREVLSGRNDIFQACMRGDMAVVELFLKNGGDPNIDDTTYYKGRGNVFDYTLLQSAVYHNYYKIAKLLLEKGADPNKIDKFNNNAMNSAAGNIEITPELINLLLKHHAKCNFSALCDAASEGNITFLKEMLINQNCIKNLSDVEKGELLIQSAERYSAKKKMRDSEGQERLMTTIKFLLELGADPYVKTDSGTAYDIAKGNKCEKVLKRFDEFAKRRNPQE